MTQGQFDSPKQLIEEMKKEFIASIGGLGTITRDDFFEFDRAVYGVLVLKPSKRLSATLSVQREIVVLICNFARLQVRTVRAVLQIINQSEGRYETALAMVVHQDPGGDTLLKNWGREQKITILPVRRELLSIEGRELEATLRFELYSNDPFDITGPVSNDAQFFGRRTEAQDLARKLQQGQIRSLLGIRKIGNVPMAHGLKMCDIYGRKRHPKGGSSHETHPTASRRSLLPQFRMCPFRASRRLPA